MFYNITILAIPCNGIVECINGEDEQKCQLHWSYTVIPVCIFYFIIFCMWSFLYIHSFIISNDDIKSTNEDQNFIPLTKTNDILASKDTKISKGNELASLKVEKKYINFVCVYDIILISK